MPRSPQPLIADHLPPRPRTRRRTSSPACDRRRRSWNSRPALPIFSASTSRRVSACRAVCSRFDRGEPIIARAPSFELLAAVALIAVASAAHAGDVYRCPAADGTTEYRDRPCDKGGSKVDARPNSVAPVQAPDVAEKSRKLDRAIAERVSRDDADRQRRGRDADAFYRECRSYEEDAARASAWLTSISPAVRASGATDIAIARRRYFDAGCANPNTAP